MDAYAVSARIAGVAPRVAAGPASLARNRVADLADADVAPLLADPDGRPLDPGPTFAERWKAVRERWSQLTFYLCDSNSWR